MSLGQLFEGKKYVAHFLPNLFVVSLYFWKMIVCLILFIKVLKSLR